jgi:predicted nuclease of predicted toxin-antitoxin system
LRILLDNCIPWRLGPALTGHEVSSVVRLGRAALSDGELLDAMGNRFDLLVTVDKNLQYQQDLRQRQFAIAVLRAKSNNIRDLLPLVPRLLAALPAVTPGQAIEIQAYAI